MKLETLERFLLYLDRALLHGPDLYFWLHQSGLPEAELKFFEHLLADGQFYVLLDLKRAEQHALLALEKLSPQTEYLREELEQHLQCLHVLFQKMEVEEHLRRDRDVLVSPPAEVAEQGVGSWITGRPTE
jgi:hypothetical protein